MSIPVWLAYVASAMIFGAIFLIGIIVYGGEISRSCALGAALFACFSQFIGQDGANDSRIYRASIYTAYFGFILALLALIMFADGR